jgi:hypothetical protein
MAKVWAFRLTEDEQGFQAGLSAIVYIGVNPQ